MTQTCHECGINLYNPFYEVSLALVDKKTGRVAFSDISTTVCRKHYSPDDVNLKTNPADLSFELGLAIDESHGCLGGVTGAVQFTMGLDRHLQFKYLDLPNGKIKFPKSSVGLLSNPSEWAEYVNDNWQKAAWADEIYKLLLNQKENENA